MKFSPSQFKTWSKCSLQGRYKYVEKLGEWSTGSSAHFGSSIHAGLELFHNGGTEEEAIEEFLRYFHSIEPDYWNRTTSYTKFKDAGPKMIKEYIESYKWTTKVTLGVEFRFMVDFGEHQLSGIVDHLYTDPDYSKLVISDIKTGAKPNMDTLHLDVQWTAYDWASRQKEFWCGYPGEEEKYTGLENGEELWEIFKEKPRENIWYDMRKNKPVNVGDRGELDYGRLYRLAEQVARAVEYEVFVPNISADSCTFCDFTDICPVYFEKPVEINK